MPVAASPKPAGAAAGAVDCDGFCVGWPADCAAANGIEPATRRLAIRCIMACLRAWFDVS